MKNKVFIINKKRIKLAVVIDSPDFENKYPGVIMFHGFKGYKEEATYSDLAKRLLEASIASIRFDASGSGESEGTFEEDYRFSNYVNDADVVYEYFKNLDFVDQDNISAIGQSMGGALSIVFSSKHPELKSVAIIQAPDVLGKEDLLGKELAQWKEVGYLYLESSKMGNIKIPYDFYLDIKNYDMKNYIKDVKIPKLFIAGGQDDIVPLIMTRRIFDVAPEPKEWIEFEELDHFYKRDSEKLEFVNKKILEFLKLHI